MLSHTANVFALVGCIIAISAPAALAQPISVTIPPDRDTTIYEDTLGALSNGSGEYLFAGKTLRGAQDRRALLSFNIAPALPAGSTVIAVELRLNCSRNNSNPTTLSLRRALAPWGEAASNAGEPGGAGTTALPGDATWLHASFPVGLWSTLGGDFSSTTSATAPLADGGLALGPVIFASTTQAVADVQSWLNDPASNFGWFLLSNETSGSTAHRFDSRENINPAFRPALTVQYTRPCRPDFNGQNGVTVQDIFDFLAAWFANDPRADFNGQNAVTVQDIFDFLAAWFAGCP